jgi:diguanylate cyclase (GGDEF)-like protein
MRLVYIGPEGRVLAASGIAVEVRPRLADVSRDADADVVVIDADGVALARARFPGARIVARVPRRAEIAPALARADDAIVEAEDPAELCARALAWSRLAADDRRRAARSEALARRVRALEASLSDLARRHAEAAELAKTDELTRLGNRRSFGEALAWALEFAARHGGVLSVVLLDVDGMKAVNDDHGHAAGDAALCRVADVLRASVRAVDHAARLGGDEFGVVMPATHADDAASVAERVRDRVDSLLQPGGGRLTASLGVAGWRGGRGHGAPDMDVVARADAALYAAKRRGRNRVEVDRGEPASAARLG